jgi:hypothetical protein
MNDSNPKVAGRRFEKVKSKGFIYCRESLKPKTIETLWLSIFG